MGRSSEEYGAEQAGHLLPLSETEDVAKALLLFVPVNRANEPGRAGRAALQFSTGHSNMRCAAMLCFSACRCGCPRTRGVATPIGHYLVRTLVSARYCSDSLERLASDPHKLRIGACCMRGTAEGAPLGAIRACVNLLTQVDWPHRFYTRYSGHRAPGLINTIKQ